MTAECVVASLACAIRTLADIEAPAAPRRPPARVLLAPSGVAWLPSSARALCAKLNALPALPRDLFSVVANADDAPDPAAPSSSSTIAVRADISVPASDAMWYDRRMGKVRCSAALLCRPLPGLSHFPLFATCAHTTLQPYWMFVADKAAEELQRTEHGIMSSAGQSHLLRIKGHIDGAAHDASLDQLRALFGASAEFHEASPWEVLSNNEHLEILLPEGVDGGGATTVFAMVAGHTDYAGRGLFVARSAAELATQRGTGHCGGVDKLQYFRPAIRGMSDLDLIAELGLRTASNAPDNERYPVWFRSGPHKRKTGEGFDSIADMMNATPPAKDWAALTLCARVVARWVQDPMLAYRERGAWAPVRYCTTFVPIPCGELGDHETTCMARAGGGESAKMDNAERTMTIGTRAKCNFCNMPKELVKKDPDRAIKQCSRCKLIWYCSERCQMADWPRHQPACKKAATHKLRKKEEEGE